MAIYTMKPTVGFWAPITVNIGTAYWSLSIGLNIIVTVAIAGRLLKMRANIRRVLGPNHSSPYTSVLAMIIESAALYTSWALIFMVAYAKGDTFQNVVLSSLGQVQVRVLFLPLLKCQVCSSLTGNRASSYHLPGRSRKSMDKLNGDDHDVSSKRRHSFHTSNEFHWVGEHWCDSVVPTYRCHRLHRAP